MPQLRFRHNAYGVVLNDHEPAKFGVLIYRKNGTCKYMPWAGFLDRKTAQRLPKAKPVKIHVAEYTVGDFGDGDEWIKLSKLQAVQGCYINGVVFGVLDGGVPRLVLRPKQAEK